MEAKHWFAEALFYLEVQKSKDPNRKIALGLPLVEIYEKLLNDIEFIKNQLGIICYFVDEKGKVAVR